MKRNIKKRMIALTLCMVMLLSGSPSVLAQDNASKDVAAQETTNQDSAVAAAEVPAEEPQPAAEEPTAPEAPTTPEAAAPEAPTTPEAAAPEAAAPEAPTTPEAPTAPEATTPDAPTADTPAPEQPVLVQEAMELKQEIKDADGKVICTVTANIPAETFTANTSDVTMEVKGVEENTAKEIKALMEKELTEEQILGEYFLYQIAFKVKGETAEPGHEIQITVEQNNFKIADTKKATVFYYNEAHSVEENEKAEIIEIAQKTELLEALKEAGESTENIDEYDLSEISLKADGTADKIQMEGRRSTVYGCYLTEKKPEEVITEEPKKEEPKEEEPKKEESKKEETKDTASKIAEIKAADDSSFTITWKMGDRNPKEATITFKYVDEEGNSIPEASKLFGFPSDETITDNEARGMSSYKLEIPGYNSCLKATIDSVNGQEIQQLICYKDWKNSPYKLSYSNGSRWKEWKTLGVGKVTGTVYMVYGKDNTSLEPEDPNTGTGVLGAPEHNKTIKKNSDTNYTLSLDVTGKVSAVNPINVLLIVDESGSMTTEDNDVARYENTNTAIAELITKLESSKRENSDLNINMAMTSFSNEGGKREIFWQSLENFKKQSWQLKEDSCDGGTNWADGFIHGDKLLKEKNNVNKGNTNYVVFLTDGNPSNWVDEEGVAGTGGYQNVWDIPNVRESYINAIKTWKATDYLKKTTTFVVRAASKEYAGYCEALCAHANSLKSNVASLIEGSDEQSIKAGFASIASKITPNEYKDVSITDTLSKYVDFPENFSKEDVSVVTVKKNADGTEQETLFGGAYTTTVNTDNKKVTVDILSDKALEKGTTYRIKFNVVPSETAKKEYTENPESDRYEKNVGDKGTDSWDNDPVTSSGQPGFYSNNTDETYVTYSTNEDENLKAPYARPVIQVSKREYDETSITASKDAKLANWDDRTYKITLNASSTVTTTSTAEPVDIVLAFDASGSMLFPASLEPTIYNGRFGNYSARLDKSKTYYFIEDPTGKATVNSVWYAGGKWVYRDASYSTSTGNTKNMSSSNSYKLYTHGDSDGHNRLYYLKEAAATFVDQLQQLSPESRIALVTFNSSATTEVELTKLSENGATILKKAIQEIETDGGTHQNFALDKAKDILTKSQNQAFTVLLTDGAPNGTTEAAVEEAATDLKKTQSQKGNVTLMTLGVDLEDVVSAKNLLQRIASKDSNSQPYSFETDDAKGLEGVFESILKSIVSNAPVTDASIIDYIDSRFEVVEDNLPVDAICGTSSDGRQYVKWNSQVINAASSNGTPGWSRTFLVKAKGDFVGGNMIPTNGEGSGLNVNQDKQIDVSFEQPSVNVKLLMPEVENDEVTLYKGDLIEASTFLQTLYETFAVSELDGTTKLSPGNAGIPELTEADMEKLNDNKEETIRKEYSYPETKDVVGHFEFKYQPTIIAEGSDVAIEDAVADHTAQVVGSEVEKYELTITFVPNTVDERNTQLADKIQRPGEDFTKEYTTVTTKPVTGVYTVNVLDYEGGDETYIEVQKTFEGLDDPAVQVPKFKITISDAEKKPVAELTLDDKNAGKDTSQSGKTIYTWKVDHLAAGSYYVQETGQAVADYTVESKANGSRIPTEGILVETRAPAYEFEGDILYNPNNNLNFSFETENYISAALTQQGQGTEGKIFFIWTSEKLSAGERKAIVAATNTAGGNYNKMTVENTMFFSGKDRLEEGFTFRGSSIKVTDGTLSFGDKKQWSHVCKGKYEETESINAEIEVVNKYTADKMKIDLKKYGTEYDDNLLLTGAKFSLYSGKKTDTDAKIVWTPTEVQKDFAVNSVGNPELELPTGYYKLVETVAPSGYQLLDESQAIYFSIENNQVTLIDDAGNKVSATQDMWKLDIENGFCISIKNETLYDLPSAGGTGIYWYLIGGVLLMLAAALILYRSKAKEVLRR